MELGKAILFKIKNMNCEFRTLRETDVSHDYVNGLKDQKIYIENISIHVSVSSQKKYINEYSLKLVLDIKNPSSVQYISIDIYTFQMFCSCVLLSLLF